jgi:hypothetical protein
MLRPENPVGFIMTATMLNLTCFVRATFIGLWDFDLVDTSNFHVGTSILHWILVIEENLYLDL